MWSNSGLYLGNVIKYIHKPPVGTIMGGLCMYFITFSKYVPLFDPIFDPSNAHQDDEAVSSLKLPIIPLLNPGSRVCPKHKTPLYKTPLYG